MVSVDTAVQLFLARRRASLLVLAPAADGVPELVTPPPIVLKCSYISGDDIADESLLREAQKLDLPHPNVMVSLSSPDGPPFRSGVVFVYVQTMSVSWRAGSQSRHGQETEQYAAATAGSGRPWDSDMRQGRPGYFLTGVPSTTNLWRVCRLDVDVANRLLFTLAPVRLAEGLPSVDFSNIADAALRAEAEQHWQDLRDCVVQHRHYGLVTAAKNVAETVLAYFLSRAGVPLDRDLQTMLQKLSDILADKSQRDTVPFRFLDYHLISKMRILHAHTHPGKVVAEGRRISPEFALTVADDLVEVLNAIGVAK